MSTLTLRNNKGSPLTNQEGDDNLSNLLVAIGGTNTAPYTLPVPSGTGSPVLTNNATLVSPALGTPTSGNLTNCTFPTLNQNTTGTAAGLSTTLAITSGGTGAITAADALSALGGSKALKTISNKTAAYTVVASDLGSIINCTSGIFTISLTSAATLGAGFTCTIWNSSNTAADAITIDPNASETIDGAATLVLRRGEGLAIVCNGTNWETDDKKPMRAYAENFTAAYSRPIASGSESIAMGNGSTASGGASIAYGYSSVAGSNNSVAFGINSNSQGSVAATGAGAMALGGSYASGTDSFAAAIANNTSSYGATGANSIAIGRLAKATSADSVAIGSGYSGTGAVAVAPGAIVLGASYASGVDSFAAAIGNNTSSYGASGGQTAIAIGYLAKATGGYSVAIGQAAISSGSFGLALGVSASATASYSVAIGCYATAAQIGKFAYSGYVLASYGDSQFGKIILIATTTTTTTVVLTSNAGAASTTNQLIVATNQAMTFSGMLIAKQTASANMASYMIKGAIVNNGGTVSISSISIDTIVDTIGLTTQPTFTADNTNKALAVTSGAKLTTSIRWLCNLDSVEVIYA
jgi:hypothetical protein